MADWHYYKAPGPMIHILGPFARHVWPTHVLSSYRSARSAMVAQQVSFNDPSAPVVDLADLLIGVVTYYILLQFGDYLVIADRPISALASYRLS